MNDIVRLPTRLRLVTNAVDARLELEKPRFSGFSRSRRNLLELWHQLIGGDELTDAELREEAEATGVVLLQILDLHRGDHPTHPVKAPPTA